jgi:hypothetical protein
MLKRAGALAAAVVMAMVAIGCEKPPPLRGSIEVDLPHDPAGCDPLGGERCYLPFPNDYFTVRDRSTDTGRRVNFAADTLPANAAGVHMDPTELNRNDGFSPGSTIAVLLPGVDLEASGVAPETDMERSLDRRAPIVIIDATTGKRHPYWAELDAGAPDDAHRLLFVRPAENFKEGHRYIVALRDLVDGNGGDIAPSNAFRAYRDRLNTHNRTLESRRAHMEGLFDKLRRSGVGRRDLVLAWDFTVASERSLSERVLSMRDDAFRKLGRDAPDFQVTSVTASSRENVLREVQGTFQVPNYLTGTGAPGAVLNNGSGKGSSPIPRQNGMLTARFICTVPTSAVKADGSANPTRSTLYGHGLLGSAREVYGAGSRFSEVNNSTYCATWWIGMSEDDAFSVLTALQDLSTFRTVPDRLQQSMLNFLYLGRLMKHPEGLGSDPAFQAADGTSLLDGRHLDFVGVSQGGILGGATTAIAQDWNRALLGVPAMNYSTLLDRSVDFDVFATVYDPNYPDRVDREMGIVAIQMLWDRGENNGYAQHIADDPYRGTPRHQVLLFEAFGDHQVANIGTEVMARTIDAEVRVPALAEGRSSSVDPFWGIREARRLPDRHGSYLVVWDFGTPTPPVGNVPNRGGEDPHGMGRDQLEVLNLAKAFLERGELIDTCAGGPCQTLP